MLNGSVRIRSVTMRVLHRHHSPRRRGVVASALALVAATSGCGFTNALAHPAPSSDAPTSSFVASPTASHAEAAVAFDLVGSLDGRQASLQVSAVTGENGVPWGLLPDNCRVAPGFTEYAAISVMFVNHAEPSKQTGESSNLRLDLSVAGGSGLGILAFEGDAISPCDNAAPLPSSTTVQSQDLGADEHQTFSVYVVAPTDAAGAGLLRGVTLQLRNPRHHPDDIDSGAWTWGVQHMSGGRPCPGDPNSVCVPLG
jgi:hypothetical protein